jgi:hypothetical protein
MDKRNEQFYYSAGKSMADKLNRLQDAIEFLDGVILNHQSPTARKDARAERVALIRQCEAIHAHFIKMCAGLIYDDLELAAYKAGFQNK